MQMHSFDDSNRVGAMKTYRSWIHNTPICYQLILKGCFKVGLKKILDYGCGPEEKYVREMEYASMDAVGVDFSIPGSREEHLGKGQKYDIIVVSNVLNVMDNEKDLRGMVSELRAHLAEDGIVLANYPTDPRKLGLSVKQMTDVLSEFFAVERISRDLAKSNVVFRLSRGGE